MMQVTAAVAIRVAERVMAPPILREPLQALPAYTHLAAAHKVNRGWPVTVLHRHPRQHAIATYNDWRKRISPGK